MPNRIIKESVRTSEEINELSWFEECLFYRLITAADDNGRFDGRAAVIKGALFPLKDNVTKRNIEDAIAHLVKVGLLHFYEVDYKPYVLFPTWEKHQRVRNKRAKYPEPTNDIDNNSPQLAADCRNSPQLAADCRNSPPESNPIQSESNPIRNQSESELQTATPSEVQAALDAWNSLDLGQVKKLPSGTQRYTQLKTRLKEYGLEGWLQAIEEIKQSKFLHGENDKHWKITFDWLVKPNNFPKVHDGNYHDQSAPEPWHYDYGTDEGYVGL